MTLRNAGSSSKSKHSVMFLKISVLKNFEMFTVKYLCWSLLFNDAAGCIPKTSLKRTLLPEYRFNKVLGIQPGDVEK